MGNSNYKITPFCFYPVRFIVSFMLQGEPAKTWLSLKVFNTSHAVLWTKSKLFSLAYKVLHHLTLGNSPASPLPISCFTSAAWNSASLGLPCSFTCLCLCTVHCTLSSSCPHELLRILQRPRSVVKEEYWAWHGTRVQSV